MFWASARPAFSRNREGAGFQRWKEVVRACRVKPASSERPNLHRGPLVFFSYMIGKRKTTIDCLHGRRDRTDAANRRYVGKADHRSLPAPSPRHTNEKKRYC